MCRLLTRCSHLQPPYTIQSSFIILAPLFIGAGNYLLISRLCIKVLPPSITHIHRIPVRNLTRIFITYDIFSFLVQVSGSGIASSLSWQGNTLYTGTDVLVTGLATQIITFAFFLTIIGRFHQITRNRGVRSNTGKGWRNVLYIVYISSALIIISSTPHSQSGIPMY